MYRVWSQKIYLYNRIVLWLYYASGSYTLFEIHATI